MTESQKLVAVDLDDTLIKNIQHGTWTPRSGAIETLIKLHGEYNFCIITSRSPELKDQTLEVVKNIESKVGFAFEGVYFTREKVSKAVELGCVALVDDDQEYLIGCIGIIYGILFGTEEKDLKCCQFRARDWNEVDAILTFLLPE